MGLNHDIFKSFPELFEYFLIQKGSQTSFILLKSFARTYSVGFWKREVGGKSGREKVESFTQALFE